MQSLLQPSSPAWVEAACGAADSILLDHAHCEKKAASTALGFVFRNPEDARLVSAMSRVAREELLHFERVLGLMKARGVEFRRFSPSPYGSELGKLVRSSPEKAKLVDQLLVCALIEARSCERFALLAEAMRARTEAGVAPRSEVPDLTGLADQAALADLADLYDELGPSEERHFQMYVDLACDVLPADEVQARLVELAAAEAKIIAAPGAALRLHAG